MGVQIILLKQLACYMFAEHPEALVDFNELAGWVPLLGVEGLSA